MKLTINQSNLDSGHSMDKRRRPMFDSSSLTPFDLDLIRLLGQDVKLAGLFHICGRLQTYNYPPMVYFSVTTAHCDQIVFRYDEIKAIHYPADRARFDSAQDYIIELFT